VAGLRRVHVADAGRRPGRPSSGSNRRRLDDNNGP
jgi:hypothetical protein